MIEALQALQSAIETVGKLRELSKKVNDAEFKMLLAELSGELGDAKLETANLKSELASLREDNEELLKRLTCRESGKPLLQSSVYRFDGDEGLFCTACFDVHDRKVRVKALTGPFKSFGQWECPSCKTTYG